MDECVKDVRMNVCFIHQFFRELMKKNVKKKLKKIAVIQFGKFSLYMLAASFKGYSLKSLKSLMFECSNLHILSTISVS
jgi:hypothetical protein